MALFLIGLQPDDIASISIMLSQPTASYPPSQIVGIAYAETVNAFVFLQLARWVRVAWHFSRSSESLFSVVIGVLDAMGYADEEPRIIL